MVLNDDECSLLCLYMVLIVLLNDCITFLGVLELLLLDPNRLISSFFAVRVVVVVIVFVVVVVVLIVSALSWQWCLLFWIFRLALKHSWPWCPFDCIFRAVIGGVVVIAVIAVVAVYCYNTSFIPRFFCIRPRDCFLLRLLIKPLWRPPH